jgi:hypothetical protein
MSLQHLGDDPVAIGHDDRLTSSGQPDAFAQFALQNFQPNHVNNPKVASGGYFVNSHRDRLQTAGAAQH